MIPKIIHQTYRSLAEVPDELRASMAALQSLNPGWRHCFYDDQAVESFIRSEFQPPIFAAYQRINPAYGPARADFFRYLLMFRVGGVYLDLKSLATRPLDEVLRPDDQYVLSHWPNQPGSLYAGWGLHASLPPGLPEGELQNWHLIAAPGHPFLQHVIGRVMRNIELYEPVRWDVGQKGVLSTTGPIPYTQAIEPLLGRFPHRRVREHGLLGLQYNVRESLGNNAHRQLFAGHYSERTDPVVLPAPA